MEDTEKVAVAFSHAWLILVEFSYFYQLYYSNTK